MDAAVSARGLARSFGPIAAVRGVDLAVERGSIFGLVGPDGAGKTTLLRLLCGVLTPDAGGAAVAGRDVVRDPEGVKRVIGYMPQRFSLYGDLTVAENLRFYADVYQVPPAVRDRRAADLLRFSRLEAFTDRPAQFLSGGMKQKLALACTLIHEPEVLFLDEPTTGVDPVSRREFWRILYDLHRRDVTIVVSTPYMDEAERCTAIGLMYEGRLIAVAPPGELKTRMRGQVLEVKAEPKAEVKRVLRSLPGLDRPEVFGDRVHVGVASPADAARVRRALEAADAHVLSLRVIPPSLEDVFVSLIAQQRGAA